MGRLALVVPMERRVFDNYRVLGGRVEAGQIYAGLLRASHALDTARQFPKIGLKRSRKRPLWYTMWLRTLA